VAAFLGISGTQAYADPKDVIKGLSGCFKVTYRFVEDGKHDSRFDLWQGKEYFEWISMREEGAVLRLQHYGVAGGNAMKHWREDWVETADHAWNQKVYNPNGSELRYECTAPIRFNQWSCEAGKAAKPVIRDRNREDYEVLFRRNTLQVTPQGWVQVEINDKLDKNNVVVSNEVGWNEYSRVDIAKCDAARKLAGD
jgi:hypothetical protein